MAVSCVPSDLAVLASSFQGMDEAAIERVKTYLLFAISGTTLSLSEVVAASRCFCMDKQTQLAVQNYLLCQIVNA